MRGSRKCSPAMMPRAWLRSSRAAIGPPSGSTVTRGATDGRRAHAAQRGAHGRWETAYRRPAAVRVQRLRPALRARPHGVDPQQISRALASSAGPGRHDGTPALAVEQRHAQFGFHVGDGMADGRLHPRQLAGGGAEAAGVGHGGEHAQLVRVRASSIGVSDLWNRSVALKDYHLTGSPRTGMLAASIRTQKAAMDQHETGRPGRETEQGMGRTGDAQGGTPARWAAVLAIVGAGVVAARAAGHHRRAAVAAGHGVGPGRRRFADGGVLGAGHGRRHRGGGVIARFGARRICCWGWRPPRWARPRARRRATARCWHRACSKGWVS